MKHWLLPSFLFVLIVGSVQAATVPTTISSNFVLDTAGSPWIVVSNVTVNAGATLTIDPGVEVRFNPSRQLNVIGHMVADDAVFTANTNSPYPGYWNYIHVTGTAQLNNCFIEYADDGLNLGNGSTTHCDQTTFSQNEYPIRISGPSSFSTTNCQYIDNDHLAIDLAYQTVIGIDTMVKADLPYHLSNGLSIATGAHLTILPGVELKLENENIHVSGQLTAIGTSSDSIYFTSVHDDNVGGDLNDDGNGNAPAPQDWGGVIFNAGSSSSSIMDHCVVKFGGRSNTWGGIHIRDASPTVTRTRLAFNQYGIYLVGTASPTLTYNDFRGSIRTPLAMALSANPVFVPGMENSFSFTSNAYDAIGILGTTVDSDQTLPQRDVLNTPNVTYVLLGDLTIAPSTTVTIEAGVVIKPLDNVHIHVDGALIVNGTNTEPVVFTSVDDDNHGNPGDTNKDGIATAPAPGDWDGIVFKQNSSNTSYIKYAEIDFAGTNYLYSSQPGRPSYYTLPSGIAIERSNPTIEDVKISNCTYGISCYEDAAPTITNVEITNATGTPIAVSADADPIISGVTMINPGLEALGLVASDVFFDGHISKVDMGGYTNITYVLVGTVLDIRPDADITVDPGIVIKALGTSTRIEVNGGFKIAGTSSEPVIFTSSRDDQYGNPKDTNSDGNLTSPSRNDWDGIIYLGTANDPFNLLEHFILKFAQNYAYHPNTRAGITFIDAGGTVSNAQIDNCYRGIGFLNGSTTTVSQTTILNTTEDALAMTLDCNPSFANISFVNVGFNTIGILGASLAVDVTLAPQDVAGFSPIAYRQTNLSYIINENVRLTILPGVVWKMTNGISNSRAEITVLGGLRAVGIAANPIVFTDQEDDSAGGDSNGDGSATSPTSGSWHGIFFEPSSIDSFNRLAYAELRYGGIEISSHTGGGLVNFRDAGGVVDQCKLSFSYISGVGVFGSADPSISNCVIQNIRQGPVQMSMFSDPTFMGNTVSNVGWIGLDVYPEVYTQDATVPKRDFAGYTNISYTTVSPSVVGSGVTITIPNGVVYKSCTPSVSSSIRTILEVNGELRSIGTTTNPVVFTHMDDDQYGQPMDSRLNGAVAIPQNLSHTYNIIEFNNQASDSSRFEYTVFGPSEVSVELNSASPTFEHCRFVEAERTALNLLGDSHPVLINNSFENCDYVPLLTSMINYPAVTTGNTLSGTTWRGIGIRTETLSQDYTLIKRDFAGVSAIPYVFEGNYSVGTSSVLTIEPGVILKFHDQNNAYHFNVFNGLIAEGGELPGETIVFTSVADDFYGGDTNADNDDTWHGGDDSWEGIDFESSSIDADCRLDNVVIRGADRAVECINASPTIKNTRFNFNRYGVYSSGASNPVIDSCDFIDISQYGVLNTNPSFQIKAEHCYWDACSGPTHSSHPAGTGVEVSDDVDFDPWACHPQTPIAGDVSRNGIIQAYDASLILQHLATQITLDAEQMVIGDVSGTAGLSAFDASLILQYLVDAIDVFPVESTQRFTGDYTPSDLQFIVDKVASDAGAFIQVPIRLSEVSNVFSIDATLRYDDSWLTLEEVVFSDEIQSSMLTQYVDLGHSLRIISAGPSSLEGGQTYATLVFKVDEHAPSHLAHIEVASIIANETDRTELAEAGHVRVNGYVSTNEVDVSGLTVYPNPFTDVMHIDLPASLHSSELSIRIYDQAGRAFHQQQYQNVESVKIPAQADWPSGLYRVELRSSEVLHSIPVLHIR